MKPTTQLLQHINAIDPPAIDAHNRRPYWRISSRLAALRDTSAISPDEYLAACEYRAAWERVLASIVRTSQLDRTTIRTISGYGATDAVLRITSTVSSIRCTETTLGSLASSLLFWHAVDDLPWTDIAAKLHRQPRTVRNWTISALHALPDAWDHATRHSPPRQ